MSSKVSRPSTASSSSGPASLSEQRTLPSPRPVVPPETSPASSRSTSTPRRVSACAVAAPTMPAPTTATRTPTAPAGPRSLQREAGGEGVGRVEQVLAHAGDPRPAGDLGNHGGAPGNLRLLDETAGEAGADDRLVHEGAVERELAAGMQLRHPRRRARTAPRAVES